jgi:hypothetical protein
MDELINLLTDWSHWAFEIISGGVFFAAGLVVPERWNPVKRLVARHDRDKHGAANWIDSEDPHPYMSIKEAQEWYSGTRPKSSSTL